MWARILIKRRSYCVHGRHYNNNSNDSDSNSEDGGSQTAFDYQRSGRTFDEDTFDK